MPVVRISIPRLTKMVGASRDKVLDRLPYVGLDIESVDRNSVRVEYSPNRPDFGTDFGVARALRGLLGKETGLPTFATTPSGIRVSVDKRLSKVRPYIACVAAYGLKLDEEDVRQMISLQEDLHNGLGRKRRVVAIGLHDMDAVSPPLSYSAVGSGFKFAPLGSRTRSSIAKILTDTAEGKAYRQNLPASGPYPLIIDSKGTALSFPPIINGDATKVTSKTRSIFVDVTSTDMKAGDDVLAVLATTLAEMGAKLRSVAIGYAGSPRTTPDLSPIDVRLDVPMIRSVLGLDLTLRQVSDALARSRMQVKASRVLAPRYRVDILHPVDIAEEVALGYGVDRIAPVYPPSSRPGFFNHFEEFLDSASTVMAGAGMVELMTFELVDEKSLYANFGRPSAARISVHDPRSLEHSILRDSLVPTLMATLSGNAKSDYPQRVFEIGRVYSRAVGGVSETFNLGCLVAHSQASFTEANSYLTAAIATLIGKEPTTSPSSHWAFAEGRCAAVRVAGKAVGHVGELTPQSIDAFGIKVPVSGFEVDLTSLHELLK